eukprot:CAMPEP_0174929326 /NCGR_PEP_ID=MMETSP1355-20121228/27142_1 /TAXON_ID=464990 /ORGANISM="Hemiselmis tepida, Strain CCMP443" /LENGTH=549 /DNA_ID=CAMNT_0016175521 /DNA_START=43 /DNA_END=1688 /DNA_ORIENTATION=+
MSRAQSRQDVGGENGPTAKHRAQEEQARRAAVSENRRLHQGTGESGLNLTVRQRVWYTMENPNYSTGAKIWSTLVMATILVSSASFITLSLPEFYQEPPTIFYVLEVVCVIIFTIEYVIRLVAMPTFEKEVAEDGATDTPDKVETWGAYLRVRLVFMRQTMNMVDLMAILPFYIEEIVSLTNPGGGDSGASSLAVIRIIRIARVFRLLKLGKHNEGLEILVQTMQASWSFLVSVMFLVVILQVLFGSLIFYAETSSLDCVQSFSCMGGPDDGRECTLLELPVVGADRQLTDETVFEQWSSSVFASKTASGQPPTENGTIPVVRLPLSSRADPLQCQGEDSRCESVGNICFMADGSVTLFNSIPITMWWALVTMCCVGFGDLRPVTTLGQFIGACTAITGVIVLAMPTTVIGTNFSDIYDSYYEAKEFKEQEEDARAAKALKDGDEGNAKERGSIFADERSSNDSGSETRDDFENSFFESAQDKEKEETQDRVMRKELQKSKERDDEVLDMIKKWNIDMAVDQSEWEQLRARALLAGMIKMEELGDNAGA